MKNVLIDKENFEIRREFDLLENSKYPSRTQVRNAELQDLEELHEFASAQIPGGIADIATIRNVMIHNRHNLYLFHRNGKLVGVYAMMMLNSLGLERLLLGELNTKDPDLRCLAQRLMTPHAIYKWAVVAPARAADGICTISNILRKKKYRHANFFSRPNTPEGMRINLNLGFRPICCQVPGMYRYVRLYNKHRGLVQAA